MERPQALPSQEGSTPSGPAPSAQPLAPMPLWNPRADVMTNMAHALTEVKRRLDRDPTLFRAILLGQVRLGACPYQQSRRLPCRRQHSFLQVLSFLIAMTGVCSETLASNGVK